MSAFWKMRERPAAGRRMGRARAGVEQTAAERERIQNHGKCIFRDEPGSWVLISAPKSTSTGCTQPMACDSGKCLRRGCLFAILLSCAMHRVSEFKGVRPLPNDAKVEDGVHPEGDMGYAWAPL